MLTSETLNFLFELSQNNNREWFEKNKARYERDVKKPFESAVGAIIQRIKAFEPQFNILPKDCIFRIYRDTRFSKDKTPYKTHLGAIFTAEGRKTAEQMSYPGYYLQLEYGQLSIGGGAYFLDKTTLHRLRTAIVQQPGYFHNMLDDPMFASKYGALKGDKNKVLPPEFKEAAEKYPLLYNKQFYFMAELDPELALGPGFVDLVSDYFKAGYPLNVFMRESMI